MSRIEQYELAVATIIAGIFGQPLFQNFLDGKFATREQWTLGSIMICVSVYGLMRLYITYKERREKQRIQSQHDLQERSSHKSVTAKQLTREQQLEDTSKNISEIQDDIPNQQQRKRNQ